MADNSHGSTTVVSDPHGNTSARSSARSVRQRGCITLLIILAVAIVVCGIIPFVFLTGQGIGMALPVITVPGEALGYGTWLFGANFTNTLLAVFFTDLILILFVFLARRASNNWKNEVPNNWIQNLTEVLVGGIYNFGKGIAGDRINAPLLWPLVGSIFFFLLVANLTKLFPGVESFGQMHCAHIGTNGYAMKPGWTDNSYRLYVDGIFDAGTEQSEEAEHACYEYFSGYKEAYKTGFPVETAEEIEAQVEEYEARVANLTAAGEESLTEEAREEFLAAEYYIEFADERIESARAIEELEPRVESLIAEVAELEALVADPSHEAEEDHSEEGAAEGEGGADGVVQPGGDVEGNNTEAEGAIGEEAEADVDQVTQVPTGAPVQEGDALATQAAVEGNATAEVGGANVGSAEEGDATPEAGATAVEIPADAEGLDEVVAGEPATEENIAEVAEEAQEEELASLSTEEQLEAVQTQRDAAITELNLHRSQLRFPHATLALSEEQLNAGAVPYIFHITPFLRGAATDLNLTFALAIIAVIAVQAYGVWALGPAYFEKFVNISALGNLGKRPLGAIDFVVGLIEIISEIGKIVSLAFRLFGNLFAGGVALLAISFLVSWLVPGVIYGLELIIGSVQALVFAVLTLVFSAQAMESHHHDDEHEDHSQIHDDTTLIREEAHGH
jgi:F0F1-type ATP synthase membrane subunit a